MKIYFHKNFSKGLKKLRSGEKKSLGDRMRLFRENPFYVVLNNHALSGIYRGYRSINISGNLRALYEPIAKDAALFIIIDTHSNLYK